jgi:hypothetical protein
MINPGLKSEKEFKEKTAILNLTEEQSKAICFYQDRARKAYEQREQRWEYFDGLTFHEDYLANRQASNTYLRPKANDDEVRVNTGTTEKKIEVVYNELLGLNLQPKCRAFDQDDTLLVDLGDQWTDVVLRSNEIEKDDDIYSSAILELLTQRAVFMQDQWEVREVRDRQKKVGTRSIQRAKKRIISGNKVFLGDIKLPWYRFNDQPFIILYDRIPWKEAETLYRNDEEGNENPMWKYAKNTGNQFPMLQMQYGHCDEDEVEVLTYYSFPDDEKMTLISGIPMDEVGTKLPWEYNGYNMRMFVLKTMGLDWAYGKPLTASAKTLQSLDNESIRLVIRKWRQALEPAMGAKKQITSKDIWSPAAITYGIDKDDIFMLNPNNRGIDNGDFGMLNYLQAKTEEFIGAGDLQQGLSQNGKQTATEIREQQRQFITLLGGAVLAVMAMKRDMSELRTFTLLENATKPIDKTMDKVTNKVMDVYRQFTKEETDLGNGTFGTKVIKFNDRSLTPQEEESIFEVENKMAELGNPTRFFSINVKKLLEIPINWFWSVSQSPKNSEQLDKVMFEESLNQAAGISKIAGRPLAGDAIIQDFEQTWKKKDWFQKAPPQTLMADEMNPMDPMNPNVAQDMKPNNPQKPSLNTMADQTPTL